MVRQLIRWWFCTLLPFIGFVGTFSLVLAQPSTADRSVVILVSIDGWRWDYVERYKPSTISKLAVQGVRAEGLVPVFPSKTFPNHYTIVTGLYPHRHGIVSNNMIDPALSGRFSLSMNTRDVQQDTRWWGGEPIWVTAERQGQIAATMFWPGSDVEIAGDRPTYFRPYEHELPNNARVDQLLEWLEQPDGVRPTFLTLYFSDIDDAGHDFGPDAPELAEAVARVDIAIARLLAGLDRLGLARRASLVLVSDHGMAPLDRSRTIVLDDYVDMSTVEMIDSSPVLGVNPRGGSVGALYAALKGKHPALQIFLRDELPEHLLLRGHPRLPAVIGVADDGWHITSKTSMDRDDDWGRGGNHGYEPRHRSMHGLFIAAGPQFRSGMVVPAFENVHIYELLCRLLDLRPASNDGDASVTASFFR